MAYPICSLDKIDSSKPLSNMFPFIGYVIYSNQPHQGYGESRASPRTTGCNARVHPRWQSITGHSFTPKGKLRIKTGALEVQGGKATHYITMPPFAKYYVILIFIVLSWLIIAVICTSQTYLYFDLKL